ncbi:MAG: GPW/gp25 family protein [Acidimicrobiia bacterium]
MDVPERSVRLPTGEAPPPSHVGRGLAFPMRVDHTGAIALTSGAEDIDGSLRVVISTAPGERVMRPLFGCRIWDLLFEPINATTLGLMAQAVRDAVAQWEPRVELEDVTVVPDADRPGLVRISLAYRIRTTNDRRNLVYPFYVIPQED